MKKIISSVETQVIECPSSVNEDNRITESNTGLMNDENKMKIRYTFTFEGGN